MPKSRLARLAASLAVLAALLFLAPALLIQAGLLEPLPGFRLFLLSGPLALLSLALGLLGLYTTRRAAGRGGRGQALLATLVGVLILGVIGAAASPAGKVPQIHDITTDPDDPPRFDAATELPANREADMTYPGEAVAAQQRAAYPDLEPLVLPLPAARVFDAAVRTMEDLGWEIVHRDRRAGAIEAVERSTVFRFADDVVVRIRKQGASTRVDVRSRSRVGRSDLGVNAERIRRLLDALRQRTTEAANSA